MPPGSWCHPLTPASPQVMVVVKYLFQFGFFPWNGYATLVRNEGKPFFPPRILGLEKTDHYIKYDLIQLLALFFHRSLLLVSPGVRGHCHGCCLGAHLQELRCSGEHPVGAWWLCHGGYPRHPSLLGPWGSAGADAVGWGVRCVGLGGASRTLFP